MTGATGKYRAYLGCREAEWRGVINTSRKLSSRRTAKRTMNRTRKKQAMTDEPKAGSAPVIVEKREYPFDEQTAKHKHIGCQTCDEKHIAYLALRARLAEVSEAAKAAVASYDPDGWNWRNLGSYIDALKAVLAKGDK